MEKSLSVYRAALGRFSFSLLEQMLVEPGNILFAGPSVFLALAMTMNGAAGKTKAAMREALGLAGLTAGQVNQASQALLNQLKLEGEGTDLFLANSVWLSKAFNLSPEFARICIEHYLAQVGLLDHNRSLAVEEINQWVKERTRGKIDGIVDDIPVDAALYLINAVHFQADWLYQFDQALTRQGLFKAPQSDISVSFMHSNGDAGFIDVGGIKGVVLSYKDADFSFFAMLPPGERSVRDWLSSIAWPDIIALLAGREYGAVELALPKFIAESELSLVSHLARLGMADAFAATADFSRLSAGGRAGLRISEVKHKAFCQIDEMGTEAAAATSVQVIRMSLPYKLKQVAFDRPFFYGIIQEKSSLPLFLGLMENPIS